MAYIAGWAFEKKRSAFIILCALGCAEALNLGLGALWLAQFVGMSRMLAMGVLPFIPGGVIKTMGLLTAFKKIPSLRNDNRSGV